MRIKLLLTFDSLPTIIHEASEIFDEIFYETLKDRWGEDAQERFVGEFISKYRQLTKAPNDPKCAGGFVTDTVSYDSYPTERDQPRSAEE
jgi:hypothetical protein